VQEAQALETKYMMINFKRIILFCAISFTHGAFAVELPYCSELKGIKLGISYETLKSSRNDIEFFDLTTQKDFTTYTGIIFEKNVGDLDELKDGSLILYNFSEGQLSSVTFANKKNNTPHLTSRIDSKLYQFYGDPEIGHVARLQNNKIVKILHKIYFIERGDNNKVIVLSSSEDGVEMTLLGSDYDDNELKKLFYSYEEQSSLLVTKGLEFKQAKTIDYLANSEIDHRSIIRLEKEIIPDPSITNKEKN